MDPEDELLNLADDDPGWITCPGCGTLIPLSVSGIPHSHTCPGSS